MGGEIGLLYEGQCRPSFINCSSIFHSIIDTRSPCFLSSTASSASLFSFAMSLFSNMNDKSAMRAWPWLWYIRLVQIFITLLVLILAALDANAVQDYLPNCGVPPRIAYNLACVCSVMVVVRQLIATDQTCRLSSPSLR